MTGMGTGSAKNTQGLPMAFTSGGFGMSDALDTWWWLGRIRCVCVVVEVAVIGDGGMLEMAGWWLRVRGCFPIV